MAEEENVDVGDDYDPEAEVLEGYSSQVNLPEIPVVTGEEDENALGKFRTKLYRWVNKEWKERGVGELKLLENKATRKIRVLMRQEKTHKIVANHFITGEKLCILSKMNTNDKAWIWNCFDFSDDKPRMEKLCARFTSVPDWEKFQQEFERCKEVNKKLMDVPKTPEVKKEELAAQPVETIIVKEVKEEEKKA